MAKVSFTKLGLKVNQDIKTIEWNDQIIEVKQYLPINEKLDLISRVLSYSEDENKFFNQTKTMVYMTLEILYCYTNINFTDKQKEDPAKLYDLCVSSGFINEVINAIPEEEYAFIEKYTLKMIKSIYKYRNSIQGMLDIMSTDYNATTLDFEKLREQLTDPNAFQTLKDIAPIFTNQEA